MSNDYNWGNTSNLAGLDESITGNDLTSEKFNFGSYCEIGKYSDDLFEPVIIDDTIRVSLADINNLNIIINDGECSNSFIESICQQLDRDGVRYTFTRDEEGLDVTDAVVLTLDQQYVSGPRISILGSYDNSRHDSSDALALAMDTAFRSNGVGSDGVFCGKRGYRTSGGHEEIRTRVPTPTEEAIAADSNTSFVTVSFGTDSLHPEDVARIIEDGFARYVAYVSKNDHSDLIYRTEPSDDLDSLASKFGTSSFDVSTLNNVDGAIPCDEAIINPVAYRTPIFDANVPANISNVTINRELR